MNLNDPKIVVAIENAVIDQVAASGITGELHRLDGEKIIDAILEQLGDFVLVDNSELETLKSDNDHFTKVCIDWTDRAYKQRAKVEHIKNEVERFKQSGTHLDLSRFLNNLIEFSTFKHDTEFDGFVLVPKDHLESMNEFKDLYKRAIINARKRKDQLNWAHVAGLGVGSGRAVELCKMLNIDPGATNMHEVIEAQEQKG